MKMGRSYVSSCLLAFVLSSLLSLLQLTCSLPISQNLTSAHPLCNHDQSNALLHFKKTIKYGAPTDCYTEAGANLGSWKEGSDCCSWDGVRCNEVSGDVVELDLSCSGLNGSIRSNSTLFHLPHLQSLNLSHNSFPVFQISSNFGKELKYLDLSVLSSFGPETLNFSWNNLKEITNLTKLIHLDLSQCNLKGELASVSFSNLEKLEHLKLDYNHFSGGFPISLGNLSKLTYLSLSGNKLPGQIPSFTNGFQAISTMKLDGNSFSGGPIPSWLFNRSSLQVLDIRGSLLVGALPSNNITLHHNQLMHLDLSDNGLTGTIPSELFASPSLVSFSLAYNHLTGSVGEFQSIMLQDIDISSNSLKGGNFSSISKLVNLRTLDLSSNNLAGTFELDLFSSLEKLEFVSLSENIFLSPNSGNDTSYLPLPKLRDLMMDNCNANEIPFFIRNLVGTDTLYLSKNNIQGLLPEWLRRTSIYSFRLSDNSITGGLQNLPLGCDVHLSFNKLRSLPDNISVSTLDLSNNLLESGVENLPSIHADEVNLSFNKLKGELKGNISNPVLDLSGNSFTGGLQNLPLGSEVDLSFNKLRSLPSNLSVYSFDMSHNFIETGIEHLSEISHGSVDLSFNKIRGTLPGNISVRSLDLSNNLLGSGVENLPSAYAVDLSCNKLKGELKGNISISHLNLSYNSLTGAENIQGFGLRSLDLSFNNLQGTLPILSGDKWISKYLVSNNQLSGNIHSDICEMGPFEIIDLSYNDLSGNIPECFLKIPSLSTVDLKSNNFSGIIPQTITTSLEVLGMSRNQLQGIIPRSLANCRGLGLLDLSNNLIYDTFPTWLEDMPSLEVLMLGSNKLHGKLSTAKSTAFTMLRMMDLSNNNLVGVLPSHYFQSWAYMMEDDGKTVPKFYDYTKKIVYYPPVSIVNKGMEMEFTNHLIKVIDFSNNKFEGVIPESIGDLSFLMVLNLSSNHFSGEIPSFLGKLVQLNSLDLSNNNLSGRIPGILSSLTFLGAFNVSDNNLEGPIPQGGQLTTFSSDSFKGNQNLCGIPMETKCGEQLVPHSTPIFGPLEENDKSLVDGFTWESVAIGYGCGFILGVLGGVLILNRYQEFVLGIFNIRVIWRIKRTPQR